MIKSKIGAKINTFYHRFAIEPDGKSKIFCFTHTTEKVLQSDILIKNINLIFGLGVSLDCGVKKKIFSL